jgi:hypothetical protein
VRLDVQLQRVAAVFDVLTPTSTLISSTAVSKQT